MTKGKTEVVRVRVEKWEAAAWKKYAEKVQESLSEVIRRVMNGVVGR